MKKFTILLLFMFSFGWVFSQSVSSTYTLGDIPTNYDEYSASCNGAATPLVVSLPSGDWLVTSVDVSYDITAQGGGWMSEQRSMLACQETGLDEGSFTPGTSNSGGTMSYDRSIDIANGVQSGDLTFELQVYRTYGSSPACGTDYQKVDDGTWTVTVNYEPVPVYCLDAPNGQWPSGDPFTNSLCDGNTETVSTSAWTGEYSLVNVTEGNIYGFSTSVPTDFITIADETGTTGIITGITPVEWVADFTGVVQFIRHDDDQCNYSNVGRSVFVSCSEPPPPVCLDAPNGQWPSGDPFTNALCDGNPEAVTTSAWTGEYSLVNVTMDNNYSFSSSVATDFITLATEDGATAIISATTPLEWKADFTGVVRFIRHDDDQCNYSNVGRSVFVACSEPPPECEYSVELYDSWGDGWDGYLDVIVDGTTVLDNISLADGPGPETFYFTVATGSTVEFDYTSTGFYAYENEYYVFNHLGNLVFSSGEDDVLPTDGQITGDCADETGTLDGLISDDLTTDPIEGATVTASNGTSTYSAVTDETGAYELILPVGEYDVTATAQGYEPGEPLDVLVVILFDQTTTQNFSLFPILGASCSNPIVIDEFPYEDLSQTNCGLGDTYDQTACLGSYDNGEDILYTFEITETIALNFTLDPKGTTYAGFGIFEGCPDLDVCVDAATNGSSSDPLSLENVVFEPGTYFLMIDTWSAPDCIPDFDLTIEVSVPGYIEGLVIDMDTDEPIEGVEVVADPGGFTAFTNVDGEYILEVYEGVFDVSFMKPEYFETTVNDTTVAAGETIVVDAALELIPMPDCADLIYPAENQMYVLPMGMTFEWENGSEVPVDGYRISIYDFLYEEWVLEGFDVGNQTIFTTDLEWNRNYGWQIQPYNIAGFNNNCLPQFFTTSNKGVIDGMVTASDSGLPLEGVDVLVESVSPNPGMVWTTTTAADGSWGLDFEDGLEEGTYDLFFQKYGYDPLLVTEFEVQANNPTMSEVALVPAVPFSLPFVETWDNGNDQLWGGQVTNWIITTLDGNPIPTAAFSWSPRIQAPYSEDLNSYYLDGTNAEKVYAQIDLSLNYYNFSTLESFSFMVYDGTEWHILQTWDNSGLGDIPWDTYTYDITQYAAGNVFLVGFRAEGTDTFSFDYWYFDNILVTGSVLDANPDVIADVMFFNGTEDHTVTLTNTGNAALSWEIDALSLPLWITADVYSGDLDPGATQDVVLTLDATVAGAGTHNGEVLFTAMDGFLETTVDVNLEVYEENGQEIMIPGAGEWGYISSYIDMNVGKMPLEEALAAINDELIIMVGTEGIYWPGFEINTIGDYNTYEGYKMKMGGAGALAFLGDMVEDQTVTFPAGTYIIPILTWIPVDVQTFFDGKAVEFAFGMDGSIYWPEGPIYTLETFMPGYGYLVKFTEETTLDFGIDPPKDVKPNNPPMFENSTVWNDVYKTGDFHMVGISQEAAAELQAGDIIGVFNTDGLCTGMMNYTGNDEAIGIPVFADDLTTEELDGMTVAEPMIIKIFRNGEAIDATPVYSVDMPNHDGLYETNGLSMITSLKAGSTSIGDEAVRSISVYPNPSDGIFNIDGISSAIELQVTNSHGQVIAIDSVNDDYMLDISDHPAGVYFIRLVGEQGIKLVKVIKQ